ncbi:hypothetical protein [Novipirellula sp.]
MRDSTPIKPWLPFSIVSQFAEYGSGGIEGEAESAGVVAKEKEL